MRRLAILACLLPLTAMTPPPPPGFAYADRAGNRYEALAPERQAAPAEGEEPLPATYCSTARDWCATVRRDEANGRWELLLYAGAPGRQAEPRRFPIASGDPDVSEVGLWPFRVRETDGALLVGIKYYRRTMYSGGSAGVEQLQLLRLAGEAAPATMLETAIGGSASIRACFGRRDMRNRAGACQDEYELIGNLTLDAANAGARPRLLLTARARTYPGRRDREHDSESDPPLRRRDLVWWNDPVCSYRRNFAFAPDEGRYRPDSPLPDCAQYLDP
jgi:hypothetical protein